MAQSTFTIDKDTNDLMMDPDTFTLAMTGSTAETVAQRIRTEMQTYLGEYVLNVNKGLPYFAEIMKKNPNMTAIRALLVSKLGSITDVKKILSLEPVFDSTERRLVTTFRVVCADGNIVEGTI